MSNLDKLSETEWLDRGEDRMQNWMNEKGEGEKKTKKCKMLGWKERERYKNVEKENEWMKKEREKKKTKKCKMLGWKERERYKNVEKENEWMKKERGKKRPRSVRCLVEKRERGTKM